jgi:hypothetical protein
MVEAEFHEESLKTQKLILTRLNVLIRIMAYANKSKLPRYLLRTAGLATDADGKPFDD